MKRSTWSATGSKGIDIERGLGPCPSEGSPEEAESSSTTSSNNLAVISHHKTPFAVLILLLGVGATAAFLTIGVQGANKDERQQFQRRAAELMMALQTTWMGYETFGLWIHQTCRHYDVSSQVMQPGSAIAGCTRDEFRELYEYIVSVRKSLYCDMVFSTMWYSPSSLFS